MGWEMWGGMGIFGQNYLPETSMPTPYSLADTYTLLQRLSGGWEGGFVQLDEKKHRLLGLDEAGETAFSLRLPLAWPAIPVERPELATYLAQVPEALPVHLLLLIQVGAAAIGCFDEEDVLAHKAIKKYMKRHSRGRAQIHYLNTRGKSKAGSRIRLANTERFVEEINERLAEWEEEYDPARILYSCSPQLWGLLFQADPPPPFDKKDPRLVKVPLDVNLPSYEELLRVQRLSRVGWLTQQQPERVLPLAGLSPMKA